MNPGEHGRITERCSGGRFFASTYVRDSDSRRRRVERSSDKSVEDARRILQRHLVKRRTPLTGRAVTDRITLEELFEPGMFGLAVRYDVLAVNPLRETVTVKTTRKATRAATPAEFEQVRTAVRVYANREGPGPRPGRLLPAFVDLLVATGCRPNEVLALRWADVDLLADPPTVTVTGTLIDHGRVVGKPLHRQDARKGGAPEHTVLLPRFGVESLAALVGESGMDWPVFANRAGGWMSLANMRRALRAALPEDLSWVTPHSFRRTVATVVRDAHGPALAQQQLSHAKLATTEAHYLQRQTRGPDVRATLEKFAGQQSDS